MCKRQQLLLLVSAPCVSASSCKNASVAKLGSWSTLLEKQLSRKAPCPWKELAKRKTPCCFASFRFASAKWRHYCRARWRQTYSMTLLQMNKERSGAKHRSLVAKLLERDAELMKARPQSAQQFSVADVLDRWEGGGGGGGGDCLECQICFDCCKRARLKIGCSFM